MNPRRRRIRRLARKARKFLERFRQVSKRLRKLKTYDAKHVTVGVNGVAFTFDNVEYVDAYSLGRIYTPRKNSMSAYFGLDQG